MKQKSFVPDKLIKYSVPFFAFAIVSRAIEEISFFYYAVPVMCAFFIVCLFISSRFKLEQTDLKIRNALNNQNTSSVLHHPFTFFLIPGLWFLLTSLWSSFPEVSATRALYFILISTGCMSAGILWIRFSGKSILDFFIPTNIFIVLLSLFSLITNIPSDSWTGGHGKGFMGFFGHQNLLASVLLFTMPVVFSKLWKPVNSNQSSVNRHQKSTTDYLILTSYFLLLTANLLLLALTYSRASILALIFGVIVFLILNKKWKVFFYGLGAAVVVSIIIYLTPSLNDPLDKIIKKDFPEIYSSRIWMWEPSYKAALEGRLVGLGYGISHPEIRSGEYSDHFENERLIREKGNSTLALIEETGLIGFVLFSLPILYLLFNFRFTMSGVNEFKVQGLSINEKNLELRISNPEQKYLKYHKQKLYLLSSTILALIFHSQFEAWWVGVGSVQLPLFFVALGLAINQSVIFDYPMQSEEQL